jgi:hypothetical protein
MKIPSSLKIGAHTVKVVLEDKVENDLDGMWDSRQNCIKLHRGLPASQLEVTLIHEIIHACNMEIKHSTVESLSQQLHQVFVDNKLTFDGK